MSQFSIDLDSEAVFFDGSWHTREDLSRRIRAMLDAGDFNVATPSLALQELTQTLAQVRTLAFRCAPDLADALTQLGARSGQSVSSLVREAVTQFVAASGGAKPAPAKPSQPVPETTVRVQHPAAAVEAASDDLDVVILAQSSASQDDLPKVIVEEQPMVIAGPGALRAAGVERPIELTNVKRQEPNANSPDESVSSEHRWFKQ